MKLSRKELKEIIKEHLDEGMFDWVPPLAAKKRKASPSMSEEEKWHHAVESMQNSVMPALWGTYDNPPHPELLKKGQDLMVGMKAAGPKKAMNEEQVEVTDVKTLIALLNVRSGQDDEDLGASRTEARLSPKEADQAVALLRQLSEGT